MEKIREILKKNKTLVKIVNQSRKIYYRTLTIISPKLNTRVRYKNIFGTKLNLKNPQTFNEKLLWLKLNNYVHNPLVWKCADKVQVKDYLIEKGFVDIVIPNIGVYNSASEIDWDSLPNKFVIKWNFGAGMNIVCTDKSKLDIDATIKQLNKWGKNKCWLDYSEMQYKKYPKKILIEEYLEPISGKLPEDYKFYCFNGKMEALMVMKDRDADITAVFKDRKWNTIETIEKYGNKYIDIQKPEHYDEMIKIVEELSKDFPFVRVDLYYINNKIYFGEFTFTPAAGLYCAQTKTIDMGKLLEI